VQLGGWAQAACEVLAEISDRHRPAALALQDWGKAHRFAGARDRAAIGNLVYDVLRKRASLAFAMEDERPEALVAAALTRLWGFKAADVIQLFDGSKHAPQPLPPAQAERLLTPRAEAPPDWVAGDYPDWLGEAFEANFGAFARAEGEALAARAPIDLRVNTLKADRAKVLRALLTFGAEPTQFSPFGVRLPARQGAARSAHVEAEPGHGKGWFEVQDEGSQIAAILCSATPRLQVADICAGAGGKTLALAATMQNTGQIHAFDADAQRLRPMFERLKRAGVRNVQVLHPGDFSQLGRLAAAMDRVVIDAPCTGSGVWRRRPDTKWRLTPESLKLRLGEQRGLLAQGAALVKPGGRLIYITCSVLGAENQQQIAGFLAANPEFRTVACSAVWRETQPTDPPESAIAAGDMLQLTPLRHGTDGFFVAVLERRPSG